MHIRGRVTARLIISAALLCSSPSLDAWAGDEQSNTATHQEDVSALDRLAAGKDYKALAAKLLKPADDGEAGAAIEWSAKAPPLDGAALANVLWSKLILGVAMAHPDAPRVKERAAVLLMYAFLTSVADGAKCADTTANGAEQLLFMTGPLRARLSDFSADTLERLIDEAIALEAETSPRRSGDPSLCRFGIKDYARATKKLDDQKAGRPVADDPPPEPDFAPTEVWRPRQEEVRKGFRQYLHVLFALPPTPPPKP
jgi:hypothetical protein